MFYTLYLGMEVAVALCVCSKCAYISKLVRYFPFKSFLYVHRKDLFDTFYLIMMAAMNVVGSRLIPLS